MSKLKRDTIKVLIADDEEEFATTLAMRLSLRHFECLTAFSGRETLELVAMQRPHVVLLDLKMPDLDGLEVLAALHGRFPAIKVIFLTGHGSFDMGQEGERLGAADYLVKPVDLDTLIAKIEEVCSA